ncbi:MAG: hypothetical protein QM767_02930 [Anaeromyxobacter sp.]
MGRGRGGDRWRDGGSRPRATRRGAPPSGHRHRKDATRDPRVQPGGRARDGKHQPCHRGHYFVQIADRDHIFFEYARKETSATLLEMFEGYSGYIQADAKSVYDVLFREPGPSRPRTARWDTSGSSVRTAGPPTTRDGKFWEATCTKSEVAREGLARIGYVFALDALLAK